MKERIIALENDTQTTSKELVDLKEVVAQSFTKVVANFDLVVNAIGSLEQRIRDLNFKVDHLNTHTTSGLTEVGTKIDSLSARISNVDNSASSGFIEVGTKIDSQTEEISKIGAVTGYNELFRNQAGLS